MYFVLCIYAGSFEGASAIAASRGPYWAGMPPVWVVLTAFPALPCPEISEAAGQARDSVVAAIIPNGHVRRIYNDGFKVLLQDCSQNRTVDGIKCN